MVRRPQNAVIASAAKQSPAGWAQPDGDCFVAALLAMTSSLNALHQGGIACFRPGAGAWLWSDRRRGAGVRLAGERRHGVWPGSAAGRLAGRRASGVCSPDPGALLAEKKAGQATAAQQDSHPATGTAASA